MSEPTQPPFDTREKPGSATYDQAVAAKRRLLAKIGHLPVTVGVGKIGGEWAVIVGIIGDRGDSIPKDHDGVRVVVRHTSEAKAASRTENVLSGFVGRIDMTKRRKGMDHPEDDGSAGFDDVVRAMEEDR